MRESSLIASRSVADAPRHFAHLLAVLCMLAARPALAHEFWIEPEQFRPAPGDKVPVRLFVGQIFKGESMPWLTESFERFTYTDARGSDNFRSILGDDPAGTFTVRAPGRIWLVNRSALFSVTYEKPGEFEAFLAKEGLEHLVPPAKRAERPIREFYSRCAKSLLVAGRAEPGTPPDRAFGLPIELIAETDPYAARPAPDFTVRLLLHGKPLAGALVIAYSKGEPERRIEARTDAAGRARLKLERRGAWLLNAVHLFPARRGSGGQWETLWASLTFEKS